MRRQEMASVRCEIDLEMSVGKGRRDRMAGWTRCQREDIEELRAIRTGFKEW
jgi:hypothetical protein